MLSTWLLYAFTHWKVDFSLSVTILSFMYMPMAMFAMKIRYYYIIQNNIDETRYCYIAEAGI